MGKTSISLMRIIILFILLTTIVFIYIDQTINCRNYNTEIKKLQNEIETINSQKRYYMISIEKELERLSFYSKINNELKPISLNDIIFVNITVSNNYLNELTNFKEPSYLSILDKLLSKLF